MSLQAGNFLFASFVCLFSQILTILDQVNTDKYVCISVCCVSLHLHYLGWSSAVCSCFTVLSFFKIIAAILTTFLILLPGTYVPRSWCTEGGS